MTERFTPLTVQRDLRGPEHPRDFHVCSDFLDPLVIAVQEWDKASVSNPNGDAIMVWDERAPEDLNQLRSTLELSADINGLGLMCLIAGNRNLARRFSNRIRKVTKEARHLAERLEDLPALSEDWHQSVRNFSMDTVRPFANFVSRLSVALRQHLPSPRGGKRKPSVSSKTKGKVGAPRITGEAERHRYQICEAWAKASECGISRKQFARDRGIPRYELDVILNWDSTRRRRQKAR